MPTPMPPGLKIGSAEPVDAFAAFERRSLLAPSFRWEDVYQQEHAAGFAVAGVAQADVLALFQEHVNKALAGGGTLADFAKALKPALVAKGWWGDIEVTNPATGETRITRFDDARLQLIYDVNLRQSYAAGRWARIERTQATKPLVMYRTMRDERVRHSHAEWDGLALPVGHPFWRTHYPPNGWRCRCRAFAVSERDLAGYTADGDTIKREAPPVQFTEFVNRSTGEVSKVPVGIDPGFAYNPGQARPQALAKLTREAQARLKESAPAAPSTQLPAAPPTPPVFQAQRTAKAAAQWAVKNGLADRADYDGISPEVANAWNRSMFDHLQRFPELRQSQKFIGTGQAQFAQWHEAALAKYVSRLKLANPGADEAALAALAERMVKPLRMKGSTWAHSWEQPEFSGVAVNKKWGADVAGWQASLLRNVETKYHPPGCDTIRSVVDHELGHQIDTLLGLSQDQEVRKAFSECLALGAKDQVSEYAAKNIAEFIAECWAESLNNPAPRPFAKRIAAIIQARYEAKFPPPDSGLVLPPPDLDFGLITSGLCDEPEAQDEFDRDQAGKPPAQA